MPVQTARRNSTSSSSHLAAPIQIGRQGLIIWLSRVDQMVIDSGFSQSFSVKVAALPDLFQIPFAHGSRIDLQFLTGFQVTELRRSLKREFKFSRVLEMEYNHIVLLTA